MKAKNRNSDLALTLKLKSMVQKVRAIKRNPNMVSMKALMTMNQQIKGLVITIFLPSILKWIRIPTEKPQRNTSKWVDLTNRIPYNKNSRTS